MGRCPYKKVISFRLFIDTKKHETREKQRQICLPVKPLLHVARRHHGFWSYSKPLSRESNAVFDHERQCGLWVRRRPHVSARAAVRWGGVIWLGILVQLGWSVTPALCKSPWVHHGLRSLTPPPPLPLAGGAAAEARDWPLEFRGRTCKGQYSLS